MDMDYIDNQLNNIEQLKEERLRVKPYIDKAIDFHSRARGEVRWKNFDAAIGLFKQAIEHYQAALDQKPRYYLKDLIDRIDEVIGELIQATFSLKSIPERLHTENGVKEFVDFIKNLKEEEKKYLEPYDIAIVYQRIADRYFLEGDLEKAYEFYRLVVDCGTKRPFLEKDTYIKMGKILTQLARYKEALIDFVESLSYDRENKEAQDYIVECLERLGVSQHKSKFLTATPKEAKKLIMEIL